MLVHSLLLLHASAFTLQKREEGSWIGASIEHMENAVTGFKTTDGQPIAPKNAVLTPEQAHIEAFRLHKALRGLGTDNDMLIQVIGTKSSAQVQQVREAYDREYKRNLINDLGWDTSFGFRYLLVGLTKLPAEFDADHVHYAVSGPGTDEIALIETLGGRSNKELAVMQLIYEARYKRSMYADVASDTSGHFKEFLLAFLTISRPEGPNFDGFSPEGNVQQRATIPEQHDPQQDAAELYQALQNPSSEEMFRVWKDVFTTRSYEHIGHISDNYKQMYHAEMGETLRVQFSSIFSDDVVRCFLIVHNRVKYLADRLHKTIVNVRPFNAEQTRLTVFARDTKLGHQIQLEYRAVFGHSIGKDIRSYEWGPHFRKLMITAIESE